jgi:hypothetical protein
LGKACTFQNKCINAFIFQGKISDSSATTLESSINEVSKIGTLCFHSAGGEGKAMVRISRQLREHNIATCMANKYVLGNNEIYTKVSTQNGIKEGAICASACSFILLSSDKRILVGDMALIGIHSPFTVLDLCFCDLNLPFSIIDDKSHISKIISMLSDPNHKNLIDELYTLSLKTKSKSMHFMSKTELQEHNIFNQIY